MKKFLCDRMCSELGRWLRTAGYDTVIINTPLSDQEIFKQAVEENRLLLTRDRDFKEIDPEEKTVIYLSSEDLDKWTKLLKDKGVNWLFCPFSRCLQCNTPFEKRVPPIEALEGIPKGVKEFWYCSSCQQLFWRGSHTERMESQLTAWQNPTTH